MKVPSEPLSLEVLIGHLKDLEKQLGTIHLEKQI